MGKVLEAIDDSLADFLRRQQIFFVGTAPRDPDGHLNISPKGLDTFRILGPRRVGYLDLTGSGIETVAHLRENRRITLMFCAFEGKPRIVRLYGHGQVIEPGDALWEGLAIDFPDYPGARSIIVVELDRIGESCGFAVPFYEFQGAREQLIAYAEKQGQPGMDAYKVKKNARSIDGLVGLRNLEANP